MVKNVLLWYVILSLLSTLPFIWAMYSHDKGLLRQMRETGLVDSRVGRFYLIRQHRSEPLPKGMWFLITLLPIMNLFWFFVFLAFIRDSLVDVKNGFGLSKRYRRRGK